MAGKHLKKLIALTLVTVTLFTSSVLGLLVAFAYVGSSATRIRREHGLRVPSSAHRFVCRGDAWMHTFMDSGAASAFEMATSDLPGFVSQLKIHETYEGDSWRGHIFNIFPMNSQYQIHRPWMSGAPLKTYRCESPTGDSLDVQIRAIDDAHVGVLLYTDWN